MVHVLWAGETSGWSASERLRTCWVWTRRRFATGMPAASWFRRVAPRRGTVAIDRAELLGRGGHEANLTVGYARVSSHDQKADPDRQHEALEAHCAAQGWQTEIIRDRGSGLKYDKPGLKRLTDLILRRRMGRLVLMRFGAELVFAMCASQGIEVVVMHPTDSPSFEEEPAQAVMEIMTVFSARLYGRRSHKSRRLIEVPESGATDADGDAVES